MNYLQWKKNHIRELKYKHCFALSGKREALVSHVQQEIADFFFALGYEVWRFSGSTKASYLEEALNQYGVNRVVLLKDINQKSGIIIEQWLKSRDKNDRSVVVITTSELARPAKGEARYIPIHRFNACIDCGDLTEEVLIAFVKQELGISVELAIMVVDRCPTVSGIFNECTKLKMFPKVTSRVIKGVIIKNHDADIVDCLMDDEVDRCLSIGYDGDMFRLVSFLIHRIVQVAQVKELRLKKLPLREIIDRSEVPPHIITRVLSQAKKVKQTQLEGRLLLLFDADRNLRKGIKVPFEFVLAGW